MTRRAAIALGAAALVALAAYVARVGEDERRGSPVAVETPVRDAVAAAPARDLDAFAEDARPAGELVAIEAPRDGEGASFEGGESAELSATAPFLRGEVVVLDSLGGVHREQSGRFVLLCWTAVGARGVTVDVRSGVYSVPASEVRTGVESISIQGPTLGHRETVGEHAPEERLPVPVDGRLDLVFRWPPRLVLRVRDPDGNELARVRCIARASDLAHPGDVPWRPENDVIPLSLPSPPAGPRAVYVGAKGLAWARVDVPEHETEQVLTLAPGGSLSVRVQGADADPGTWLRLFVAGDGSGAPFAEIALGLLRAVRLDGLPEGEFVVSAQLGDRWTPRVLAAAQATVRAGDSAKATLVLEELEAATWTTVEGTVAVPRAWELAEFDLVLGRQDAPLDGWNGVVELPSERMELVQRAAGLHRWSARVQPGRYSAQVFPTGWFEELEIGPEGASEVHIEVPPPWGLRGGVLDDATGAEAAVDGVDWASMRGQLLIPSNVPARRDHARGCFELVAAAGRVLVRAFRDGEIVQQIVEATPGIHEITLRFPRRTGLAVVLLDGGSGVPWNTLSPALEALEGQPVPILRTRRGERALVLAREPGAYRLVVPDIPGYERVLPVRVELRADVVGEHVVELRRSR